MNGRNQKIKKENGITLVALIVTIIVLIILASISVGALTGDDGIISQTLKAKEDSEISGEKEILEIATIEAMKNHKFGYVTKIKLQNALDKNTSIRTSKIT